MQVHRNLIDAGLHVYAYEGIAAQEIAFKALHLVFLGAIYCMAADVRYKQHTSEHGRYEETLAMIAFTLQAVLFQAILALYIWLAVLTTRVDSLMRKIHIFIAFFVLLPIGFAYLYYSNIEIIAMLIETEDKKEPEAKHPSVFLLIIFWIMVGNISTIFLMLNTILMGAIILSIWLYNDWRERSLVRGNFKKALGSLKRGVSRVFGDKQCVICTEEFQKNDQVVQLRCHRSHVFHSECMELAVQNGHYECPLCRKPII